jgi:hypothetical protein
VTPLPTLPPTPAPPSAVFVLTNASNGLYLGAEESLRARTRCSFAGGGINCKPSDLVTFGLKGRWQTTDTWYGLWDPSVTFDCSKRP